MSLSFFGQKLELGKLALAVWYQPVGRLKTSWRNGGPWVEAETERQREEMEAAAALLPPLPAPAGDRPLGVHLLTGRRFWYQTAFCLSSFAAKAGLGLKVDLYDDGTLVGPPLDRLRRLLPSLRVHPIDATREKLDALLPRAKFPTLRERWDNYPNLRKLIDPHLGSTGWKLVIDSDLIFFRRPAFIIDWLKSPDRMLHAVDCEESYGYSRPLMERLAGAPIPPLVNVGLCGLKSDKLDWAELEFWCRELIAAERTNYYLEQALVAMLAARAPTRAIAPVKDYLTKPDRDEGAAPTAIMHHFVADSKRSYYRHGWRIAQTDLAQSR